MRAFRISVMYTILPYGAKNVAAGFSLRKLKLAATVRKRMNNPQAMDYAVTKQV
jgi:hypothetical protein